MRAMKNSGIEWIEEIPEKWEITRLKSLFDFGKGLPITKDDLTETGIAVISYGQIHSKSNNGISIDARLLRFVPESFLETNANSLTKMGDILVADTSEDLDGCGNAVQVDKKIQLFAGYHTIILKSKEERDNRFLAYTMLTDNWRSQLRSKASGVKLFSISKKMLGECSFIYPPASVQREISDYLDGQCICIDKINEKTKSTIEVYKKLRQAIIAQAVTKGVRGERLLKDSGSIWFGDIPEEWNSKKLKYQFHIKKDIAGEEGYTVLSITQRGIIPKDLSKNEGQLAESYANYQFVNVGDFAMNHMDLLTGWVDISKYDGVTSPDYRVFVLDDAEHNNSQYFLYLMQMCYSNRIFYGLGQGVSGLGRWRLQADKFLNFVIPIPPFEEQKEIAAYLDQKCSEIDALIAKKEQFLVELEKYKKSMIYEYVTGKKEVPHS